ncbi:recombinase family protein [Frankia sp. Mgl5]|uniref:recombinase family protein n=1 Tax=Frankia sp. Mgl5 TaxID=2933793 RepID=UPI00200BF9F5|nr:recombinase family protein [Frankia sp. Mgl5]MCK9929873.1 recombinase family protein [Frankia sp. Mgl5]
MVLYARYSELVGRDDALERQDGYEFAEEYGATIEKVYQEKGFASKKKTIVLEDGAMIRPDYAELRSSYLDGAIVWDLDRLTRDLRDLEDAIEVVELYGRPIVGHGVDLTTEYGKANTRAQAVAADKAAPAERQPPLTSEPRAPHTRAEQDPGRPAARRGGAPPSVPRPGRVGPAARSARRSVATATVPGGAHKRPLCTAGGAVG